MSKADRKRWQRTSPLASIFYLGRTIQAISKNAVQSLAPLVAFIVAAEGNVMFRILLGGSLFVVVIVGVSITRYLFFRYRITDDSVLIRDGVFKKKQLDIKFDRIQAINTQQNVIYRYFGLVTVKFDTAGSAKEEGNLPAIKMALAQSLKDRIRRDHGTRAPGADNADGEPRESSTRPLLSLVNKDMVRIGLSSNRALIFLVLLGPALEWTENDVESAVQNNATELMTNGSEMAVATAITLAVVTVLGFILFLVAASITGAFLRYHGFRLLEQDGVFRSTGGLLTRHEHSVNLAKIQSFEARQNPVLGLFKRFRIQAKQASSGKPGRGKHFVIPLCTSEQLQALDDEVFRDEFQDVEMRPTATVFEPISRRYFRSRLLLFGVLPALLVTGVLLAPAGLVALVFLLWIPIAASGAWSMYKKRGYFISEHGMVLRRGFLGIRTNAFLHRKVQRVSVTQTPLQERHGLSTIRFYLASGSLKLPYVEYDMAKQLRDFVLYRVESSRLAWH
jgi:putative membrane protein